MEDQKHHLDEIFRRKLHDAEVPPPPFVWPAVEQALQPRRRRRPVAFWWFAAAGTVLLGVVAYWTLNRTDSGTWSAFEPPVRFERPVEKSTIVPTQNQSGTKATETFESTQNAATADQAFQLTRKAGTWLVASRYPVNGEVKFPAEVTPISLENEANHPASGVTDINTAQTLLDISNLPLFSNQLAVVDARQSAAVPSLKPFKAGARRKKIHPKVCYDFNRHPSALLIDVYAGPSIAQRSLTSRQDDEPYLKQRLATERRDLAFNAGIRASLMFQRNFLLRTGLHYEQITEVFEYIDPTSVTYTLKFTPGNPIPDTIGVQYGENYLKTYNRYGTLDIPLMLGVEMRSGRTGFNVNAGISANVLFWKRGAIIDPQTHEPARFGQKETLSEEVFRTRLSLSAGATVQWYWHASNRIRLFVEPSFRQVLRPVTLPSHPVDQRYSILGLRLGSTMIF